MITKNEVIELYSMADDFGCFLKHRWKSDAVETSKRYSVNEIYKSWEETFEKLKM